MNHEQLNLEDKLFLVGELEHARRHALRSAKVTEEQEDRFFYLVTAAQAQQLRRRMQATLEGIEETDWCLTKTAQAIRQLNYETMSGDTEFFEDLESFVDSINSHTFKQDMSGCKACAEDSKEAMLASNE